MSQFTDQSFPSKDNSILLIVVLPIAALSRWWCSTLLFVVGTLCNSLLLQIRKTKTKNQHNGDDSPKNPYY